MTGSGSPTPEKHRLLALDGGGMRGAFTLGVLGVMEEQLRCQNDAGDDFVLARYFDFIGGTSTGAIIAAGLALGWSVAKLKERYRALGRTVFKKRFPVLWLWSKYPGDRLRRCLQEEFGERNFDDPDLLTRLMIVLHNRTTDSPWPLSNEPNAMYNDRLASTHHNLDQKLWKLLSASTAAPSFFPPQKLDFGAGPREFVDGGVTAHNNPALQLFLAATLPEYKVGWDTGSDALLLISVGTGSAPALLDNLSTLRRHILYVATKTPSGLMFAAANHNDVVCRSIGDTRYGPKLDSELEDMVGGGLEIKLLSYARYNLDLQDDVIASYVDTEVPAKTLAKLDAVAHVDTLMELGESYARTVMRPSHFTGFPVRDTGSGG